MTRFHSRSARLGFPLAVAVATAFACAGVRADPQPVTSTAAPGGAFLFLDPATVKRLRADLSQPSSGMNAALEQCRLATADPVKYRGSGYQGMQFASRAASCALAFRVTGQKRYGRTAMRYFLAILDDYREVGDGAGGDDVVTHNTGYSMRTFAPFGALTYDWLRDAPGMTPALRARARHRFLAWAEFYRTRGYLRDQPGANYHAGYAFGIALMAAAMHGDRTTEGDELFRFAAGELFGHDISAAMAEGGVLHGGDWPEGWQYGPLGVTGYALGARALTERGAHLPGYPTWAASLVRRYTHGLVPSGRGMWVGGDTGEEAPHLKLDGRILYAAIVAPGSGPAARAARGELAHLSYQDKELPVLQALAESITVAPGAPMPVRQHTAYFSDGTSTLYARSSWSPSALWFVTQCSPRRIPDHSHYDAGTFELVRGRDDLIIDTSPYGSMSTLTSNAPTIDSTNLLDTYRPSQGPWGQHTDFTVADQTSGGVTVARCDYADQFRFRDRLSEVTRAVRSFVLVGSGDDAALIVWDEAAALDGAPTFDERFRTPLTFQATERGVTATAKSSVVSIERLTPGAGQVSTSALDTSGKCWNGPRGKCRYSRIPGTEYRFTASTAQTPVVHVVRARRKGSRGGASAWKTTSSYAAVVLTEPGVVIAQPRSGSDRRSGSSSDAGDAWLSGPRSAPYILFDTDLSEGLAVEQAGRGCRMRVPGPGTPGSAVVVRIDEECHVQKTTQLRQRKPLFDRNRNPALATRAQGRALLRYLYKGLASAEGHAAVAASVITLGLVLAARRYRR